MRQYIITLAMILLALQSTAARTFSVSGRVVNEVSRQPIGYVAVIVDGQPERGAVTNPQGEFTITGVEPEITRLVAQSLGYELGLSEEVQISATTPTIEILMVPSSQQLDSIIVRPSLFRRMVESPVSMRRIGVQQIEKSPGANRDVSRIVQSYPGVSFSPAGYRNDLIVRGGSPTENRFFVDGVEIPNINHFATGGASGGPVGILNADLIREIEFYSGAFPVQRSGALSSVMDVKLRKGNTEGQSFKATLGASEVSLSGSGHFSPKTSYLFSMRQSYLQLLFKALQLPFLPNFIDGQIKVTHKITPRDDLTLLALGALDHMTLNESAESESAEYILGYLPQIEQKTLTTGVRYRHFSEEASYSVVASHSYLNDTNTKYFGNDDSSPENLNFRIGSTDQKTTLRSENRNKISSHTTLQYGAEMWYSQYRVNSLSQAANYKSDLGIFGGGIHLGALYKGAEERLTISLGVRGDGNNFSAKTSKLWRHISPRLSTSYALPHGVSISCGTGLYYSMPAQTTLSYKVDGVAENSDLDYIRVAHYNIGMEWRPRREMFLSVEGFYKNYSNMLVSERSDTPMADLGADYGVVGNEAVTQQGRGRAYGVEAMGQVQIASKLSLVGSLTLFRSEYATSRSADFHPSAWDNRLIFNASGTYSLPRKWSIGAKVSAIGGAPYTPYDVDASSLIINWDIAGRPTYDYSLYNTLRNDAYAQLDLRVDKSIYFSKWMLGLYLDLQNVTVSKFRQADIPVSSGVVDATDPTRYQMEYLSSISGTLLPTVGITAQF